MANSSTPMAVLLLFPFIFLIHKTNAQAFLLCTFGHTASNKYIAGKTTYFKRQIKDSTLWISNNHPPETPNKTYIYEDLSSNQSCWAFGTASSYDQRTKFATCTICNSSIVKYPEYCPLWNISGYGIDPNFKILKNEICGPDDWNTNNSNNTHKPLSICSWNISSNQMNDYYFMNDETWYLFTIDTNGNAYYYNSNDVKYIYQYYNTVNNKWLWAVSDFVGDNNYKIFCEMTYKNMDITLCKIWVFYNTENNKIHSSNNIVLQALKCPKMSHVVCVYDSSNIQLNGKYDDQLYPNDYDGWKKDNLYLIYRNLFWYITTVDLSIIYASCQSSLPYNPIQCNNKWILHDINTGYTMSDTLKIWNYTCDTIPTISPTSSPILSPTISPTLSPTFLPTFNPTINPSLTPTNNPSYIPTNVPNINPTVNPTYITYITTNITMIDTSIDIDDIIITGTSTLKILPKLSTDTFMVMLGIFVLVFICCFFAICSVVYWFRNANPKENGPHKNVVVENKPRFRETKHLEDSVDQSLQQSITPKMNTHTQSIIKYDSQKHKYIQKSNLNTRKWHMHSKLRKYDIQQQNIVREDLSDSSTSLRDIINNAKQHLYNMVIDEDETLDETYNEQIDLYNNNNHIHGTLARESIGEQSVTSPSKITIMSNQTEEKEDNLFYNAQQYKMNKIKVNKKLLSKPIEDAIFPEGIETMTSSNDSKSSINQCYLDEKYIKCVNKTGTKIIVNGLSPPAINPPPNSEIYSPSTTELLSPPNKSVNTTNTMNTIDLNKLKKDARLSISVTHKSGPSFITLFDEKKDIEHNEIDDDDNCDDLDVSEESNSDDLSEQLFATHSVVINTAHHEGNNNSSHSHHHTFQHSLHSHMTDNTFNHLNKDGYNKSKVVNANNSDKNSSKHYKQFSHSFEISEMSQHYSINIDKD